MKIALPFLLFFLINNYTNAQTTAIPDVNFEQVLIILGLDTGSPNGVVLTTNIDTVTYLFVSSNNIIDLPDIEDFVALQDLRISAKTYLQI